MWPDRGRWGVNTYGRPTAPCDAICIDAPLPPMTSIHMASQGAVGRQYIWCHRGWWNDNTYGVIKGVGASIHMAS